MRFKSSPSHLGWFCNGIGRPIRSKEISHLASLSLSTESIMPLKPVRDLLYVIPIHREDKIGSIIVPDIHEPLTNQGIVKYRGPKTSGEIKVGDHVLFTGYDGDEMVLEGEGLLVVVPEPFISAILLEGEDNYVLSFSQIRRAIDVAISQVALREGPDKYSKHQKDVIHTIGRMLKDHMDSRFFEELFF